MILFRFLGCHVPTALSTLMHLVRQSSQALHEFLADNPLNAIEIDEDGAVFFPAHFLAQHMCLENGQRTAALMLMFMCWGIL